MDISINLSNKILSGDSGVIESLFFGETKGGGGGGADLRLGGGARGRHRNDFFPIIFLVDNQKSNGEPKGGGGGVHGVHGGPRPP